MTSVRLLTDKSPNELGFTRGSWLGLVGPDSRGSISLAQHVTYLHVFPLSDDLIRLFLKLFSDDAVTVSSSRLFHKNLFGKEMLS